jgi:hypothetical protein
MGALMLAVWQAIISFLGGPVVKGLLDAYNAKLKAGVADNKIAADLAASEIAAQTQVKIAEVGHPWEVEKLFAYVTLIYYAKLLIFDKVIGSFMGHSLTHNIFSTDGLTGPDAVWGGLVIAFYFGKRSLMGIFGK